MNEYNIGEKYRKEATVTRIKYAPRCFPESKILFTANIADSDKQFEFIISEDDDYFMEIACCVPKIKICFEVTDIKDNVIYGNTITFRPLGARRVIDITGISLGRINNIKAYKVNCEGNTLMLSSKIMKTTLRLGGKDVEDAELGFINIKPKGDISFRSLETFEDSWF